MCERHLSDEERANQPQGPVAFVDELVVALTNARIYADAHPRFASAISNLATALEQLLAAHPGREARIGIADGFVFFQSRPLLGASLSAARLIEALEGIGSGGLSFDARATREELTAFARFIARETRNVGSPEEANRALAQAGCRSIRILPPYSEAAGGGEGLHTGPAEHQTASGPDGPVDLDVGDAIDIQVPAHLYQGVVGVLQDAMVQTCKGAVVDTAPALGTVEGILAQLGRDGPSLMRLARYEKYDEFTFGHSIRVCFLALNFARHLTDDRELIERIGLAALLHDIGKAWVPFEVLHSKNRLSDEERREMNMHPVHGGQILLGSSAPDPLAVAAAFSHHQNADGSGYPAGLRGGPPSGATMIVKLADVYEALTAVRPYKPSMSPARAYRIMMDMQGHFDPSMLRRFIECNGVFPIGSRVELTTGETARVVELTDSLLEPIVRTEQAASGETLYHEDVQKLDLRERFGRNKIAIVDQRLESEIAA